MPHKKVTKESGIGEAFEARAPAPAYTLPYVPHPWRTWEDFQRFYIVFFAISIRFSGDAAGDSKPRQVLVDTEAHLDQLLSNL